MSKTKEPCFSTTTKLNQGNQIKKFSKREKSFLRRFSIDQLLKRIHQKFVSLSSDGWLKAFERLDQKPELFHWTSPTPDEPDFGWFWTSTDAYFCRHQELKMSTVSPTLNNVGQIEAGSHEHLREVCLAHLNLIHKMSEAILAKDRQIKVLKENNSQVI